MSGDTLVLRGEKRQAKEEKDKNYHFYFFSSSLMSIAGAEKLKELSCVIECSMSNIPRIEKKPKLYRITQIDAKDIDVIVVR